MNLDTETWEVINSYFRDTPNYLVRHHIDSYNDFIQNKIPQIFKNTAKNPQTKIILLDKDGYEYIIHIHIGGRNHDKYRFAKPILKNYPSGEFKMEQILGLEIKIKIYIIHSLHTSTELPFLSHSRW